MSTDADVIVVARDREIANAFTKDLQLTAIRQARTFLGDRLLRVARPHRLLDPEAGPLMHGYRSLEGTFLGGCLFSGRVAGRALTAAL